MTPTLHQFRFDLFRFNLVFCFYFIVSTCIDQDNFTGKVSCSTQYWYFDVRCHGQHQCCPSTRPQYDIVAEQRQIFGDVHAIGWRECYTTRHCRIVEGKFFILYEKNHTLARLEYSNIIIRFSFSRTVNTKWQRCCWTASFEVQHSRRQ